MKVGTRSVLFGVHCFAIHPWFVAWAWTRLYGFPIDPRIWVAFFVHDLGYIGKPNMDGAEGERHVELGASIMHFLFDRPRTYRWRTPSGVMKREPQWRWLHFCLFHSRFYARAAGQPPSRLCYADKLALVLTPAWLWALLARMSGELHEYVGECRTGKYADLHAHTDDPIELHKVFTGHLRTWVNEHSGGMAV